MITKEQAINGNIFHYGNCLAYYTLTFNRGGDVIVNPTNPEHFHCMIYTNQEIKEKRFGLKSTMLLSQENAEDFHIPSECPILIKQQKDSRIE